MAAKELVYDAILRRSTDIHLEPKEDEMAVRLRIDGVMYPTEPFDRVIGDAVMNIFKVLGGMDITEKRRGQDGSFGMPSSSAKDDRLPCGDAGNAARREARACVFFGPVQFRELARRDWACERKCRNRCGRSCTSPTGCS